VRELMHVNFTPLIPVLPSEARARASQAMPDAWGEGDSMYPSQLSNDATSPNAGGASPPHEVQPSPARRRPAAVARSGSISIAPPKWTPETHPLFPRAHRDAVRALLLAHNNPSSLISSLPRDLLLFELLPQLSYTAFGPATSPQDLQTVLNAEKEAAEPPETSNSSSPSSSSRYSDASMAARPCSSHDESSSSEDEDEEDEEDEGMAAGGDEASADEASAAVVAPETAHERTAAAPHQPLGRRAYRLFRRTSLR
jgi:hypothetical protein